MQEHAQPDSRLATLSNIVFTPITATDVFVRRASDRRNAMTRLSLYRRIRDEFVEMPGTALTIPQAARLFGVSQEVCARVFEELVSDGQCRLLPDRRYRRYPAA